LLLFFVSFRSFLLLVGCVVASAQYAVSGSFLFAQTHACMHAAAAAAAELLENHVSRALKQPLPTLQVAANV
jgi:hypothetical protein